MYASGTDTVGDPDRLEPLRVNLTPRQIQWLKREADDRDLSVDHLLRSIIAAEIRRGEEASVSSSSGDPSRELMEASHGTRDTTDGDSTSTDRGFPSIVESLRSASRQLDDLTDEEENPNSSALSDTLARLQARREGTGGDGESDSGEEWPRSVLLDQQPRSMFDLVDEE